MVLYNALVLIVVANCLFRFRLILLCLFPEAHCVGEGELNLKDDLVQLHG